MQRPEEDESSWKHEGEKDARALRPDPLSGLQAAVAEGQEENRGCERSWRTGGRAPYGETEPIERDQTHGGRQLSAGPLGGSKRHDADACESRELHRRLDGRGYIRRRPLLPHGVVHSRLEAEVSFGTLRWPPEFLMDLQRSDGLLTPEALAKVVSPDVSASTDADRQGNRALSLRPSGRGCARSRPSNCAPRPT